MVSFVYIRAEKHNEPRHANFERLGPTFAHYDAFLAANADSEAFVVNSTDPHICSEIVTQIRGDVAQCLKPVYLVHEAGGYTAKLIDGVVESADEAQDKAQVILDLAQTINDQGHAEHKEDRLLRYLYMRPELLLEPIRDWQHPQIYHFPVVDALAHERANQSGWLDNLVRRNILEPVALSDRLRICPACNDAHVSFIDVCTNCGAIAIEQESFLHCYSCGLVAPQNEFIGADGLRCTKCHVQLRHIGVDYDRTLDNFCCRSCQHIFPDPEITARCHICDWQGESDDLLLRRVENLRLTETGRLSVRRGSLSDVFSVLDGLNYANPAYFNYMADWFIKLNRRYPETPFGLLVVNLANVGELVESLGRNQVMLMLDGLSERLKELIRTTDIATRTGERFFWLLLPHTPADGCAVVAARIREFQEQTRQDNGDELTIRTAFAVGPETVAENEDATLLMARLTSEVSGEEVAN